jgi:hypothetical protein
MSRMLLASVLSPDPHTIPIFGDKRCSGTWERKVLIVDESNASTESIAGGATACHFGSVSAHHRKDESINMCI